MIGLGEIIDWKSGNDLRVSLLSLFRKLECAQRHETSVRQCYTSGQALVLHLPENAPFRNRPTQGDLKG